MSDASSRNLFISFVLLISLAITFVLWDVTTKSIRDQLELEFNNLSQDVISLIELRMSLKIQAMRGFRALYDSSEEVTRDEFKAYISSLDIAKGYPGILNISYSPVVHNNNKSDYVSELREQGYKDFEIFPIGKRDVYAPILYLENFSNSSQHVTGYDLLADATLRKAMERARDANAVAITGNIELSGGSNNSGQEAHNTFMLLVPVYAAGMPIETADQRREATTGWIAATFRINDMLPAKYSYKENLISVSIYDKTISDESLLYPSLQVQKSRSYVGNLTDKYRFSVFNNTEDWVILVSATNKFEKAHHSNIPEIILFFGIVLSILLTMFAYVVSRSKSIARSLKASEEQLRLSIEGTGEALWDWNLQTKKVLVSDRWRTMLGLENENIEDVYKEWTARVHPDDLGASKASLAAHLAGDIPIYMSEHRLRHENGDWIWVQSRGVLISRTRDGRPLRMIGTHTDITDQKLALLELKNQRDFTDAVVESAGNIIVVLDNTGRFVRVNNAVENITGFNRKELVGRQVWDTVIPAEHIAGVRTVFENLKLGRTDLASRYENDWQTRDGKRITLDWHNTVLRDAAGTITHIVALGYDVTMRKKSDEKISRLTRLYSSLSHCDQAIVHCTNEQELLPRICHDAVEYGGFTMSWIGKIDYEEHKIVPVAMYGNGVEYLQEAAEITIDAEQTTAQGPTGTAARSGKPVWCHDFLHDSATAPWHDIGAKYGWKSSASLPLFVNGEVVGTFNIYASETAAFDAEAQELLVQMAQDVSFALESYVKDSQRKQAERDLSLLNATLESRVNERTEELVKAKQLADAANKSKGDFLSNMSHEIRTPLAAIIGFSEAMLTEKFDREQRNKIMSTIVRNGKHLQQIINDILDLSKIEADQLEVEHIDTSLLMVMCEIDSLLGASAREKGLEFKINYHFPLPVKINTDPTCLKQIIINLCSNAIKFTDKGRVQIDIRYDGSENKIDIIVTDTGIGMSEAEVLHVFDPFAQADMTTSRKYGGSGLGLSISRKLATALGGTLACSSARDSGSCFTLSLYNINNVDLTDSMADVSFDNNDILSGTPVIEQLTGKVLLVEDSPDNQQLISMYVNRTGVSIDIANNGVQGVEMAMANHYDLILMDMQMPVMDGVEATKQLRQKGFNGPIVSLTANALISTRDKCFEAGSNEFLVKPINLQQFYDVLNTYLEIKDNNSEKHTGRKRSTADFYHNPKYLEIVDRFVEKLPELVSDLIQQVELKNWEQVKSKSHDLKGMGGSMGFDDITEISARLNKQVCNGEFDQIQQTVQELHDASLAITSNDNNLA